MKTFFEKWKQNFLTATLLTAVCACTSSDIETSSMAVAAAPLITVYSSAYAAKAGYQNACIISDLPDSLYAKKISKMPASNWNTCTLTDTYMYMGSKGNYNYIAHYPPFGLRNILKISKDNYQIKDEFKLTSRSKAWRLISLPTHTLQNDILKVDDLIIIEPTLADNPWRGHPTNSMPNLTLHYNTNNIPQ
jgi:hypothetical protein